MVCTIVHLISSNFYGGPEKQIIEHLKRLDRNGHPTGIAHKISDSLYETPISNLTLGGRVLAWDGGGYFRLIPYAFFRLGADSILRKKGAYLFYMHPWEMDAQQPRPEGISCLSRFRHYVNLAKCEDKLRKLLQLSSKSSYLT